MAARKPPADPPAPPVEPDGVQLLDQAELDALPKPDNVIQALARVEREIKGIRKLTPAQRARMTGIESSEKGVNFAYRGIDQIASLAQPLFGEYGVVMVPLVESLDVDPILKGDRHTLETTPWTRTTVKVRYNIYGPGGIGDCIVAVVFGVGDDNSDKGVNKAMTAAFKNVLLRVLCIGDPQDDTDSYQRQPHEYNDDQPQEPAKPDPILLLWDRVKAAASTGAADHLKLVGEELRLQVTQRNLAENAGFRSRIEKVLDDWEAGMARLEQDADAEAPAEAAEPPANNTTTTEAEQASDQDCGDK